MAKAMVTPVEIVSMEYLLQSSFALETATRLSFMQSEPNAAVVSYSGPPYAGSTE